MDILQHRVTMPFCLEVSPFFVFVTAYGPMSIWPWDHICLFVNLFVCLLALDKALWCCTICFFLPPDRSLAANLDPYSQGGTTTVL